MHVYATRLLLYLIAHPSLRLLMEHLSPAAPPSPVTPLPAQPTLFASRGGGAAPPFSLEGVLKSCEHTGYREADQPEGLALALKRYQLQAPGGRRVGAALLKPPPPARIARYTPSHSPPHFLAQPLSRPPSRPSRGWSTWRTRPSCRAASTGSSGRSGRGRTEAGTTTRARWARCGCRRRPSPFGGRGVASWRHLGDTSAMAPRSLQAPPFALGGLLCDEMGCGKTLEALRPVEGGLTVQVWCHRLGKTLEVLALIVATLPTSQTSQPAAASSSSSSSPPTPSPPSPPPPPPPPQRRKGKAAGGKAKARVAGGGDGGSDADGKIPSHATLIVAPHSLWCGGGSLRVDGVSSHRWRWTGASDAGVPVARRDPKELGRRRHRRRGRRRRRRASAARGVVHGGAGLPRSPEIAPDRPRSPEITRYRPRSPEIARDHPRSPEITRDHRGAGRPSRRGGQVARLGGGARGARRGRDGPRSVVRVLTSR